MLIPDWPSKAEHGEKIQPDDDFVYGPVRIPDVDREEGWCLCDEGGFCPYHEQSIYHIALTLLGWDK